MSFSPTAALADPHVQTLLVAAPRGLPPRSFDRLGRPFEMPTEGGWPNDPGAGSVTGSVRWQPGAGSARLAVLVHGLGGDERAPYVQQAAYALFRRGFHVLTLNQRGAGKSWSSAPYLYHAGLTCDLDRVVRAFAAAPKISDVCVIGFSMGGNVALRLAGEWGDAPPEGVSAVVSLAAPVDLQGAARNLERWQASVYRAHVLRGLIASAVRFRRAFPDRAPYSARRVAFCTQIHDYDAQVIVPKYGFADVEDYYARASAGPLLSKIGVRTLLLHSKDDPMVPGASVERALAGASAKVEVRVTEHGGHLGWADSLSAASLAERWSTRVLAEFLEQR